jgi:hypothetical protein
MALKTAELTDHAVDRDVTLGVSLWPVTTVLIGFLEVVLNTEPFDLDVGDSALQPADEPITRLFATKRDLSHNAIVAGKKLAYESLPLRAVVRAQEVLVDPHDRLALVNEPVCVIAFP